MSLSVSQVQNVLRTYQKQVCEGKIKSVLGIRGESSAWRDRLDISREGQQLLKREKETAR